MMCLASSLRHGVSDRSDCRTDSRGFATYKGRDYRLSLHCETETAH